MKQIRLFINNFLSSIIIIMVILVISGIGISARQNEDGTRTFNGNSPTYTAIQEKAYCEGKKSIADALSALSGINAPQDATSGCVPTDIVQLGNLVYYQVPIATPTEFYNSVNGKGFNEGYGYQCVAGFKEFMYSLSGKYIATNTGGASGYSSQQSQIEPLGFTWHNGNSGLQNGDWAIWSSGKYGHVAMYYNGSWLGQNQYAKDSNYGNPFNIALISSNDITGFYRPNIYIITEPEKPITPILPTNSSSYTVQRGDTLGSIALSQGWWVSIDGLYGDYGYTQRLADYNKIEWRGLIYPDQLIQKVE